MSILREKKLLLFPLVLGVSLILTAYRARRPAIEIPHPAVTLWAWERPEDLSFIDPSTTEVAFLAKTIRLQGEKVIEKPRMQTLHTPSGTRLVAVTRIEVDHHSPFAASTKTVNDIAESIAKTAQLPSVSIIQVDFDAVVSERNFYRDILKELRSRLPSSSKLSITALASWCDGDNWIADLPIDEAVPMFFRMGPEKSSFENRLQSGTNFLNSPCQTAAGISTDEPVVWPKGRRVYLFNPNPWTKERFEDAMEASVP